MPRRGQANRKANIWVARTVPLLLLAIAGYTSWVVTKLVCLDYLISPSLASNAPRRVGSATAILVIYYILLLTFVITYARLLDTVIRRPGLVPRGPQWYVEKQRKQSEKESLQHHGKRGSSSQEKTRSSGTNKFETPKEMEKLTSDSLPFRVEEFWQRDVFVCKYDGRPSFCSVCYNWKPDRAHHCSELNRCVMKMDHFCPWVGGVVSETSFKFFIQFTFYSALFCLHILVVVSYFFAKRRHEEGFLNAHWIVVIAISALFLTFSAGMCLSSGQFAVINSTTIENLNRKQQVWYLAVFIGPQALQEAQEKGIDLRTISYPRPREEQLQTLRQNGADAPDPTSIASGNSAASSTEMRNYRTFAVLETAPGQNPWDIGLLRNFQDIMGETIWDWLSPLQPSPCTKHDDPVSLYRLGHVVTELKQATELKAWIEEPSRRSQHRHSKRRKPRRSASEGSG